MDARGGGAVTRAASGISTCALVILLTAVLVSAQQLGRLSLALLLHCVLFLMGALFFGGDWGGFRGLFHVELREVGR
ncbi:hypothetical protein HMPREF0004_4709 [Achromobacter piechaudii ATCC 43553]|uniref:Uncharacterized protein n=1 Tax=Achromobacter piechaudii ATCC 43553 TaxID=742159 RepID=D4XGW2_9BURK|nr:hypothetical protein HMPREF0004_4709 [Achromobacter piechaudii ATCC 43553]